VYWIHLTQGRPVTTSCEHRNEPSGSINDGGFLDQLKGYQVFKNSSALGYSYIQENISDWEKWRINIEQKHIRRISSRTSDGLQAIINPLDKNITKNALPYFQTVKEILVLMHSSLLRVIHSVL
jgi:hypothetical protein